MKKIMRRAYIALVIASVLTVSVGARGLLRGDIKDAFKTPVSGSVQRKDEIATDDVKSDVVDIPDGGHDDTDSLPVFSETGEKKFILREFDGKIGVFVPGSDVPETVIDIFVFTLPESAAALLRCGIECDEETLSGLLDSFTS